MAEPDDIANQIIKDIAALDGVAKVSLPIRERIVSKLVEVMEQTEINPQSDKASEIEAKLGIFTTLNRSLDDMETSREKIIKLKQKVKSAEDDENVEAIVTKTISSFLRTVKTAGHDLPDGSKLVSSVDDTLDAVVSERNIENDVNDGELEIGDEKADLGTDN